MAGVSQDLRTWPHRIRPVQCQEGVHCTASPCQEGQPGTILMDVTEGKGRPLELCGAQSAQQSTGALVVIPLVRSLFLWTSLEGVGCCSSRKAMPPIARHCRNSTYLNFPSLSFSRSFLSS